MITSGNCWKWHGVLMEFDDKARALPMYVMLDCSRKSGHKYVVPFASSHDLISSKEISLLSLVSFSTMLTASVLPKR